MAQQRTFIEQTPIDGAMHDTHGRKSEPGHAGNPLDFEGRETWSQAADKTRFLNSRRRTVNVGNVVSFEFKQLKKYCKKRPTTRQWHIRDETCRMDPGTMSMSPSMEAAFMRLYQQHPKGEVRAALRDLVPVLEYRHRETKQTLLKHDDPTKLIPQEEAQTLNQKKRELFERRDSLSSTENLRLSDPLQNHKLRWKIRTKLMRFQRKLTIENAKANRSVLYSEKDALAYFLFRGPPMYAALHRVFYELTKLMPWFVPKTMLDFGAGTGTAILVAKETYDPGSLAFPLYRRQPAHFKSNAGSRQWSIGELRYDLKRLQKSNAEKKKARFMAVAALVENGEVELDDIPADLRKELVEVAKAAAQSAQERERREKVARRRDIVTDQEWEGDSLEAGSRAIEDQNDIFPGEEDEPQYPDDEELGGLGAGAKSKANSGKKSWWETYIDTENDTISDRAAKRLQPLQEVVAVEPAPAMMETAMSVLHHDAPNVSWKRFLMPEDETAQHDLVISAYTLSEIATDEARLEAVKRLWKMTRGALVIVEHANLSNFDLIMKARDAILEEKGLGLWDWQPTIVGPCPHEKRCPIRHAAIGVKRKKERVCGTSVRWQPTFIEKWVRQIPLTTATEPLCYMIFARNELIPERAERRRKEQEKEAAQKKAERDAEQRRLYEESLSVTDVVQERLSDEVLDRPGTFAPPSAFPETAGGITPASGKDSAVAASSPNAPLEKHETSTGEVLPVGTPKYVKTGVNTYNRLVYPESLPPATHKYNRNAFVDSNYQLTRVVTPNEMLVVRKEVDDLRDHFRKKTTKYARIVRKPVSKGRIQLQMCTPEGNLVAARVYRRFYGDGKPKQGTNNASATWQHMGGWRLAKHARPGSLFPDDVPIYNVKHFPQVDFPNTMLRTDGSTVEKTGMMLNTPTDPQQVLKADQPQSEEMLDEHDPYRLSKASRASRTQAAVDDALRGIFGASAPGQASGAVPAAQRVDARTEISKEKWAEAVRKARQNTQRVVRKGDPHSRRWRKLSKYPITHMLRGPKGRVQGYKGSGIKKVGSV